MKRTITALLLALAALPVLPPGARAAGSEGWRFPGEYESHQAMWMLWPHEMVGTVPRLASGGRDVYLERRGERDGRVEVKVVGLLGLAGRVGWIDAEDIESAGERCPDVYRLN